MIRVEFRWMVGLDMPDVIEIEEQTFPDPWATRDLRRFVRQRSSIALVALGRGKVVGYVFYTLSPDGIRIRRMAVAPSLRRKKIGRAIVTKLVGKGKPLKIDVSEWHDKTHLFLRATGFIATGTHRDDKGNHVYEFTHKFASMARTPMDCGNQVP